MPLLSDILNFLYVAFNFILSQLKNFYSASDKNIAFLTLFQAPMTNALNSGLFLRMMRMIGSKNISSIERHYRPLFDQS